MDEAQHLADRVAILRAGEIVAQGTPDELGAGAGRATTVDPLPRCPTGVGADEIARRGRHAGRASSGDRPRSRPPSPQRALYRLLGWAEREGVVLEELEVRRPSLEDVFLELTGGPGRRR